MQPAHHDGFFHLLFQKRQLWKQGGERQVICRKLISQTHGKKEKKKEEKGIKKSCFTVKWSSHELHEKHCPCLCKTALRLIAYLVIISQFHLHLAQLPEAEKSSNYLFCKSLLLLPSSSLWHLPHPSSFLGPCDLCWARCPKGVIAPPCGRSIAGIPGDSCP